MFLYWTSTEFDEAAELLSADPGASTLSMSASHSSTSTAAAQDVKLDLSEDEEGQEESSEVWRVFLFCFENDCVPATQGEVSFKTGDKSYVCSQLLGGQKTTGGFWTFEYYQSFFNVDTVQVRHRRVVDVIHKWSLTGFIKSEVWRNRVPFLIFFF